MRELTCNTELQSYGGLLADGTTTYAGEVWVSVRKRLDALALHLRGWSSGSHYHLVQTQSFTNASNAEAKARKWTEVPKMRTEEEEEEIAHLRLVQV